MQKTFLKNTLVRIPLMLRVPHKARMYKVFGYITAPPRRSGPHPDTSDYAAPTGPVFLDGERSLSQSALQQHSQSLWEVRPRPR